MADLEEKIEPLFTQEEIDKLEEIDKEVENEQENCVNLLDYRRNRRQGALGSFFEKVQETYRGFSDKINYYTGW